MLVVFGDSTVSTTTTSVVGVLRVLGTRFQQIVQMFARRLAMSELRVTDRPPRDTPGLPRHVDLLCGLVLQAPWLAGISRRCVLAAFAAGRGEVPQYRSLSNADKPALKRRGPETSSSLGMHVLERAFYEVSNGGQG